MLFLAELEAPRSTQRKPLYYRDREASSFAQMFVLLRVDAFLAELEALRSTQRKPLYFRDREASSFAQMFVLLRVDAFFSGARSSAVRPESADQGRRVSSDIAGR